MEEMSNKVKLDKSPLIKSLLFSDKKPNAHFMILAEMNTKPEKGKFGFIQPFGKKLEPPTTMSECPKKKF
jgi:hypothetical protein